MLQRFACIVLLIFSLACGGSNRKVYRIGMDPTWYGLPLEGKEAAVYGFTDELVRAIAQQEGFVVSVMTAGSSSLLLNLDREDLEGVITALPPLSSSESVYSFSNPFLYLGPVLVVPLSSEVNGVEDMDNSLVAVVNADAIIPDLAGVPYLLMRPFPNVATALAATYQGVVAGAIVDAVIAYSYLADLYSGKLKVVTPPLDDLALRLMALKGENDELLKRFDKGLQEMVKSGKYATLAQKWSLHLDQGPSPKGLTQ